MLTRSAVSKIGSLGLVVVLGLGMFWALTRGAPDFHVFHYAWNLVLHHQSAILYTDSPDRYLYSPGFAFLLCWLGWLPRSAALILWSLGKVALVLGLLKLATQKGQKHKVNLGIAAWGCLILARSILIDFQYGQINLLIVGCVTLALVPLLSGTGKAKFGFWKVTSGFAASIKLLLAPSILWSWNLSKQRSDRVLLASGIILATTLPLFFVGPQGLLHLLQSWIQGLQEKGMPHTSHNQSFAAFLHHCFSGQPTHVTALWGTVDTTLWIWSETTRQTMAFLWSLAWAGLLLHWSFQWKAKAIPNLPLLRVGVFLAVCPILSPLLWKPHLVFGLPLAIGLALQAIQNRKLLWGLGVVFIIQNLLTIDVWGPHLGGRIECYAPLLWGHMILIIMGWREIRSMLAKAKVR